MSIRATLYMHQEIGALLAHSGCIDGECWRTGQGARRRQHIELAASQPVRKFISRQWLAEVVSLNLIAMMLAQERHLFFRLHALCNDTEIQALGHIDNRARDGRIIGIHSHMLHERPVDLQFASVCLPEIGEDS